MKMPLRLPPRDPRGSRAVDHPHCLCCRANPVRMIFGRSAQDDRCRGCYQARCDIDDHALSPTAFQDWLSGPRMNRVEAEAQQKLDAAAGYCY